MSHRHKFKKLVEEASAFQVVAVVFLTAILTRMVLWFVYGPVNYGDSASYRRLAGQILEGWENYDGSRVPGYPAFLALVGSDEWVYVVQLLLGIFITLGYFYMGWQLTQKPWFGGLAALAHQFNLGQLFFEANLLTETLATFFVTASLVGVLHGVFSPTWRKVFLAFAIGLATALAILTRPLFIFTALVVIMYCYCLARLSSFLA
jgi:hypothetical protein